MTIALETERQESELESARSLYKSITDEIGNNVVAAYNLEERLSEAAASNDDAIIDLYNELSLRTASLARLHVDRTEQLRRIELLVESISN
jgi:hypothetical protein